jgi:hypothetical protein
VEIPTYMLRQTYVSARGLIEAPTTMIWHRVGGSWKVALFRFRYRRRRRLPLRSRTAVVPSPLRTVSSLVMSEDAGARLGGVGRRRALSAPSPVDAEPLPLGGTMILCGRL